MEFDGEIGEQISVLDLPMRCLDRILYMKKPVFQCRFEPQEDFFNSIIPYLNPVRKSGFVFEVEDDEGRVDFSTYYGGLCKMLKGRQTTYVDDVVNAYEKSSDEKKSKMLKFLLGNHPIELLHPYTKEWKAKLEEMELGCGAPDEDEMNINGNSENGEFSEWVEDECDNDDDDDNVVLDVEGNEEEDSLEGEIEELDPEEDERYWEEQFKKATSNVEKMEKLEEMSMVVSDKFYKKQLKAMKKNEKRERAGGELEMRGKKAKVKPEEWKTVGYGRWMKKIKKSRIPPAAVRPFVYRNLVKEIVLKRHAILEGEIGHKE